MNIDFHILNAYVRFEKKLDRRISIQVNIAFLFLMVSLLSYFVFIFFRFENIQRTEFEKWKIMLFKSICCCFWNARHSIEIRKYFHSFVFLIVFLFFASVTAVLAVVDLNHTRAQGIMALCVSVFFIYLFFCFNIFKSEDKFNTSRERKRIGIVCTYPHTDANTLYKRTKGERKIFSTEMKLVFLLLMSSLYLVPYSS